MDNEEYLKRVKSYIKTPTKDIEQQLQEFTKICTYISGQYDEDESFVNLRKHLEELEKGRKEQNRVFYMALPPSVFTSVSQHLKKNCYPQNGIARIIVRKLTTEHYSLDANLNPTGREAIRKGSWQLQRAPKSIGAELEGG